MCDGYVRQQQVGLDEPEGALLRYLLGWCPVTRKYTRNLPKQVVGIYLFEGMIDDGRQICFGNLGKHFTHGAADVVLRPLLGCGATMQRLPRRIALNLLLDPILPVTSPGLAQAGLFIIHISELVACKFDDF